MTKAMSLLTAHVKTLNFIDVKFKGFTLTWGRTICSGHEWS